MGAVSSQYSGVQAADTYSTILTPGKPSTYISVHLLMTEWYDKMMANQSNVLV